MYETNKTDNKKIGTILNDYDGLAKIIDTVVKDVLDEYLPIKKYEMNQNLSLNQHSGLNQDLSINLRLAVALITEVEKRATQLGLSVVTAIYSSAARPIATHCMDNSYIASFDVATNKAYTAAALKMSTAVLKNLSQPGQDLYGIQNTNQGKIVIFGGGEPLIWNGKLIGSLGVSGGTEEEDTKLAEFGKNKLKEVMMW